MKINPNKVLVPIGIGMALSLLGDQTLYTVLPNPKIASEAGLTLGMVGMILGINRLARVLFNGPVGILYDRFPRRILMVGSLGIGAISTILYVSSRSPYIFMVGRFLWGIAWSGIWIGSNTVALDISSIDNRGWITGRLQMWFFLGIGLASLAGGVFTDLFGFRRGLLVSAALTFLGVIIWWLLLPETRPEKIKDARKIPQPDIGEGFPWRATIQASIPTFMLRLVFAGVITSTTILWLGQFIGEGTALGGIVIPLATLTGGYVLARVLISMLSAPLSGAISDRLGRRWVVMALVFFIGMVGLFFMGSILLSIAFIGAFFATISAGSVQGLVPAIIGDRVGLLRQSSVLGVVYTIGDLGSAVGPPLALFLVPFIGIGDLFRFCSAGFGAAGVYAVILAWQEHAAGIKLQISSEH